MRCQVGVTGPSIESAEEEQEGVLKLRALEDLDGAPWYASLRITDPCREMGGLRVCSCVRVSPRSSNSAQRGTASPILEWEVARKIHAGRMEQRRGRTREGVWREGLRSWVRLSSRRSSRSLSPCALRSSRVSAEPLFARRSSGVLRCGCQLDPARRRSARRYPILGRSFFLVLPVALTQRLC